MRYPAFRGDEPCTVHGPALYEATVRTEAMVKVMRDACASCWIVEDCREWALHHEPMSSSVWGGLTHDERKAVRRQRRIRAIDPLLLVEVSRASA